MRSSSPVLLGVTLIAVAAYWYDAQNEAAATAVAPNAVAASEPPATPLAQATDAHAETATKR